MIDLQKRKELFLAAPEPVQDMYSSMELTDILASVEKRYSPENFGDLVMLVGDVILGLISYSQLPTVLIDHGIADLETAKEICAEFEELLTPFLEEHVPDKNPLTSTTPKKATEVHHGYGAFRANEPETHSDTAHNSSQNDILQKPTLAEAPTYEKPQEDAPDDKPTTATW